MSSELASSDETLGVSKSCAAGDRWHSHSSVGGDRQKPRKAPFPELVSSVENPRRHRFVPDTEQQNIGMIVIHAAQCPLQTASH